MADVEKDTQQTIADDLVVTKYKLAGEIVNKTLKAVIDLCVPEASVREICTKSDTLVTDETSKVCIRETADTFRLRYCNPMIKNMRLRDERILIACDRQCTAVTVCIVRLISFWWRDHVFLSPDDPEIVRL